MPLRTPVSVVKRLASRGYNAEREAVTLLANSEDPARAIDRAIEAASPDALSISIEDARAAVENDDPPAEVVSGSDPEQLVESADATSDVSDGAKKPKKHGAGDLSPGETKGSPIAEAAETSASEAGTAPPASTPARETPSTEAGGTETHTAGAELRGEDRRDIEFANDVTGRSTGTGEYEDFVAVFRDRYERLSATLRSRVNHRPTTSIEEMAGGAETGIVGMISDIRSTKNGHWLIELEDTQGTFPCLVTRDSDIADRVDSLLLDEVIAVEGQLADDGGILFVDALHFPDVPRTYQPSTADRPVQAALVSDVHVGSDEFVEEAWHRFASWLHTEEAERIEYLLICGDMVEGVGVYPDQDEELAIMDIYDQYRRFSELLSEVPADLEIVMTPGNHDAVRLAEPQPAFDQELRDIMSAHDARFTGNPSYVTLEGVTVLMYHGTSLDEVIAEIPAASYQEPAAAMSYLLQKRHVAPQFGDRTRVAPEKRDYLVIEEVPDVFHAGHVHKLGTKRYHDVTTINSGCWQRQTPFQKSVDLDPAYGVAPILDLQTLDVTVRKFV